jgi:Ca2+-binding EF-hand superfamily protein
MNLKTRLPFAALATGSLLCAFGASAGDDKMQAMDANKDGMISAAEHDSGARGMFEKMDADRDGRVTAAEMDAAHASMSPGDTSKPQMSSAEKIRTIDTDGDGAITAAEHAAGSRAKFGKMDANRDGSLSADELQAGHAGMTKDNTG